MKQKMDKHTWPYQLRRLPWLLLIVFGLLLPGLAGNHPSAAEWYARYIYPSISGFLGSLSGFFPFSLVEVAIYSLISGVVGAVLYYAFGCIRGRIPGVRFARLLITLAITGGVLLNAFYVLWGFNYSRPTLFELLDLPVQDRPTEDLQQLCEALSLEAASLRSEVAEDSQGVYTLPQGWRAAFADLPAAFEALGEKIPLFSQKVPAAKGVLASEGMSYGGIAGIYIPYTAEANVNIHQPALLLLSSAAHESAHYLGIAKEDEANFVAYLACMEAGDAATAYSGVMLALIHCTNALYDANPAAFMAVRQNYSEGMVRDILAYNAYWERYDGAVEAAVNEINDGYLKHNRQQSGIKSYGLMVDLMLAWYFQS